MCVATKFHRVLVLKWGSYEKSTRHMAFPNPLAKLVLA